MRYSFSGAIKAPRTVLKGGYLSWVHPPTGHWWQQTFFSGTKPVFRDLGKLTASNASLRTQIYRLTRRPEAVSGLPARSKLVMAAAEVLTTQQESTTPRAAALRAQIETIIETANANAG